MFRGSRGPMTQPPDGGLVRPAGLLADPCRHLHDVHPTWLERSIVALHRSPEPLRIGLNASKEKGPASAASPEPGRRRPRADDPLRPRRRQLAHRHIADCHHHLANDGNRHIINPPGVDARIHQHNQIGHGDLHRDEFFGTRRDIDVDGIATVCAFGREEAADDIGRPMLDRVGNSRRRLPAYVLTKSSRCSTMMASFKRLKGGRIGPFTAGPIAITVQSPPHGQPARRGDHHSEHCSIGSVKAGRRHRPRLLGGLVRQGRPPGRLEAVPGRGRPGRLRLDRTRTPGLPAQDPANCATNSPPAA